MSGELPARAMPTGSAEWLETDGLGGFATGTVDGIRTRRYHGLLVHAATPPTGRMMLANGFEAWIEMRGVRIPITSQRYPPDIVFPDGARHWVAFQHEPWPRWAFDLGEGVTLEHRLFVPRGLPMVAMSWRLSPEREARLLIRPLLSGRHSHALQRSNPAFGFTPESRGALKVWRSYPGVTPLLSLANAEYRHEPLWYYDFLYVEERARGLDHLEDLASPGTLSWDLSRSEAVWILGADTENVRRLVENAEPRAVHDRLRADEERRRRPWDGLAHAAATYVVQRNNGRTIVAGYPWFTDWGRDTFIATRGLCMALGRPEDARDILVEWAGALSEGMLPNRFAEGEEAEYNSVDASLWYVIAAHEWLETTSGSDPTIERQAVKGAVLAILDAYTRGARHGIRVDVDGLLAAGEPGVALTWMDARIRERPVTPRIGKPVEVQALWINALRIGALFEPRWSRAHERARVSFQERFWNHDRSCLHDVVDVNHVAGTTDSSLRPNQIFAVGGLPFAVLGGERARSVVDQVERWLWTRLGLRSLAPGEPEYVPRYAGGVAERDGAYHQGTVWPWLAGPFVEAWCRVRGATPEVKREARERFLQPLLDHRFEAGLGHVSEIADADPPHTPNGCPFQAWSLGELLRLDRRVLAIDGAPETPAPDAMEVDAGG